MDADISRNEVYVLAQIRAAPTAGADVAHFPEAALSGYAGTNFPSYRGFDWARLETAMHRVLGLVKQVGMWVILGSTHRLRTGHKPHDSVYIINGQGRIVDRYDKMFCSRSDLAHYSPGTHFATFTVKGVRCGVLICYEYAFPELYREYQRRGVQLVCHSFHAGHASRERVKSMAAEVGTRFHRINRGSSYPEIRVPASVHAAATANHLWVSCSNTSARYSGFPSFFVRADDIITGRLRRHVAGVLVTTINTTERLYDGTCRWRGRAMRGVFHSGTPVRDTRSTARTQV